MFNIVRACARAAPRNPSVRHFCSDFVEQGCIDEWGERTGHPVNTAPSIGGGAATVLRKAINNAMNTPSVHMISPSEFNALLKSQPSSRTLQQFQSAGVLDSKGVSAIQRDTEQKMNEESIAKTPGMRMEDLTLRDRELTRQLYIIRTGKGFDSPIISPVAL